MHRAIYQCQRCRHGIIDSFTALAGITATTSTTASRRVLPQQIVPARSFSTSVRYQQADTPDTTSESRSSLATQSANQNSSIPWYLQVDTPTPPAPISPHLALQEIPPVPSDAPQILTPILNHLSNQMGLDNLALLDLRQLDPPPALGANLIMIIGTARSYKHLNTSVDRFCRWVRSRYKLAPYADGLLGRNELKLKLRRKARKMKLAQSVGNTVAMSSADDGITTGWICVNLGSVENARIPEEDKVEQAANPTQGQQEELETDEEEYENPEEQANDGYIGFGSRSTAPRIVVQMFVEEKRLEMDLEGLWDYRQERRAHKAERSDAEARQSLREFADRHTDPVTEPGTDFKPWAQ